MSQKLILPLNDCNVNAGWKMPAYTRSWGYKHYGIDIGNPNRERTVFSPGEGEVICCGMDGNTAKERLGNCMVLVYRDVLCSDGAVRDLACRMFHLDKISVRHGQKVQKGSVLGVYGNTGANTSGPHLHVEFDTDTKWPEYAYGIKSSGKIIKKGTVDSTVDPSKVWFLGEGQTIQSGWDPVSAGSGWVADNDIRIRKV